jgi:hypothetical protein
VAIAHSKGGKRGLFLLQVNLATIERTALTNHKSSGEQHAHHNHTTPPQRQWPGRGRITPRVAEIRGADAEMNAQGFGASTLAAVLAFRTQHGLPAVIGNATPFDASVGRLLNVAAAAADGNRAALRIPVRESVAAARNASPQENFWLARRGFGRRLCPPARTYTAFAAS